MLKHLALTAGLVASTTCSAIDVIKVSVRQWQVGRDYILIDPPQPTSTGNKIEVVEVFSYACPHCAYFQPYADALKGKLPTNAQFVLLPAVFDNPKWEPFARAFYTAKSLGLIDKTHQALFDALHRDHQPLHTIDDLANLFYANYGINSDTFLSTAATSAVKSDLARSNDLVRAYQVESTPTLIVNGKYRVTAINDLAIGFAEMEQIALDLVKQETVAKRAHKQ